MRFIFQQFLFCCLFELYMFNFVFIAKNACMHIHDIQLYRICCVFSVLCMPVCYVRTALLHTSSSLRTTAELVRVTEPWTSLLTDLNPGKCGVSGHHQDKNGRNDAVGSDYHGYNKPWGGRGQEGHGVKNSNCDLVQNKILSWPKRCTIKPVGLEFKQLMVYASSYTATPKPVYKPTMFT